MEGAGPPTASNVASTQRFAASIVAVFSTSIRLVSSSDGENAKSFVSATIPSSVVSARIRAPSISPTANWTVGSDARRRACSRAISAARWAIPT